MEAGPASSALSTIQPMPSSVKSATTAIDESRLKTREREMVAFFLGKVQAGWLFFMARY